MRKNLLALAILICAGVSLGDTPPARVINAQLYDAAGNAITSSSGSLDVRTTSSALPAGAATETTLSNVNGKLNSLGQKAMAGSAPVVLPSDQSPIPVTQSGTWDIRNITGTVSLPTGAATENKQDTGNSSLSSIDGKLNSLGQKTMAGSAPVVLPSDQSPIPALITDGTNTAAVKPSTTAPSVTDPSLVVAISPNSPITVTAVPPTNAYASGSITSDCPTGSGCGAGSTVQVTTNGYSTVGYETHGTWSATITTDVSYDPACSATPAAVAWFNTASMDTDGNTAFYITNWGVSLNDDPWVMNVAAAQCARVRAVSFTSGSVDVAIDTGVGTSMVWAVSVGNARSGSTDSGNPVKVGGRYNSTPPTFTDGQRGDLQLDASGRLQTLATQSGNWPVRLQDGTGTGITSQANGAQRALDVGVNVAGVQVDPRAIRALTSGTDTVNVNNISGTVSLPTGAATEAKQDAGNLSLASIDTDFDVALSTRASAANQSTEITSLQLLDDVPTAMNGAFSKGNPVMGQFDDVATTAATENNVAPVRVTAQRGFHVNLRDASGTELGTAGSPLRTDPTGTTPQPASQSGNWSQRLQDGAGNNITSQASSAQRALDVGINVAGVQVDPRTRTWNLSSSDVPLVSQGTAASNANGWTVKPGDGTNSQGYTASSEAKVLVTPLTNSSVVKAQLQDNAGTAIVLGQAAAANSLPVVTQSDAAPATQNITAQDTASTTTAVANSQNFFTGTATANSTASFALSSWEGVEVQVTGTWTGTLTSEVSMDGGTTWLTRGLKQAGIGNVSSSFTANFQGGLNVSGMTNYRVRATASMTGTATVKVVATKNDANTIVVNPVLLKDGTTQSTINTIKAASTAAAATDTALVVGLSPNIGLNATTPVPVRNSDGTNFAGTYSNITGSQGTNSSPGQLSGSFALGVGWDGTTHREQTVDTSGNAKVVGNVAAAATDSGNPVKIGAIYESSQTSLTSGQRADAHATKFGDLTTGDNTSFVRISTATTTTVKSGAGLLYAICYNTLVNASTVTIYDNTAGSGTTVGLVTETVGGGAAQPHGCDRYNGMNFTTGLTIVTSGATDLTVLYK